MSLTAKGTHSRIFPYSSLSHTHAHAHANTHFSWRTVTNSRKVTRLPSPRRPLQDALKQLRVQSWLRRIWCWHALFPLLCVSKARPCTAPHHTTPHRTAPSAPLALPRNKGLKIVTVGTAGWTDAHSLDDDTPLALARLWVSWLFSSIEVCCFFSL